MAGLAIPKGSLVLVTGTTGTIGAAVADEILAAGYKVRGPVRNAQKGKFVTEVFDKKHGPGSYMAVVVEDLAAKGSLDEAMKGCAGVVHLVSDTSLSPNPNDVIPKGLGFINNILSTAAKTPSVKRVVYTSSQAVLPPISEPGTIKTTSWRSNADDMIKYAWAEPYSPDKAPVVYVAAKISEERACWEFVEKEKPGFVLNSVIPGFTIGEIMHPSLISSSNQVVLGMLQSHPGAVAFLTAISPTSFVNLKDAALIHLAALTNPRINNRRLLALGESFSINRTIDLLNKLVPQNNLPPKLEHINEVKAVKDVEFEKGILKDMGRDDWTSFDASITQCISTAPKTEV